MSKAKSPDEISADVLSGLTFFMQQAMEALNGYPESYDHLSKKDFRQIDSAAAWLKAKKSDARRKTKTAQEQPR